jgi:hypothetical protein
MLTDPQGGASGVMWLVCVGGAALIAASSAIRPLRPLLRRVGAAALVTIAVGGIGLVGVARGFIVAETPEYPSTKIPPAAADIWRSVRERTPRDALIFTDQVGEEPDLLAGWNTFAYSGQRQIYVSNHYQEMALRQDPIKRANVFATNDLVLKGTKKPMEIPLRGKYSSFYAVVDGKRAVPAGWVRIYANESYSLFEML